MKLFPRFSRQPTTRQPAWRDRETALIWGTPMVLFPALAFIPVSVSLILEPSFAHARVVGLALLPAIAASIGCGVSRLAFCLRRDFDVLSLFAGGTIVVLVVISMCAGVVLASVVGNF